MWIQFLPDSIAHSISACPIESQLNGLVFIIGELILIKLKHPVLL